MGVGCAVLDCYSKQRDGARLFQYSTNYYNHDLWLKNCRILPSCKKRIFVCSKHFETSCFLKRKLKLTAVPTLCLPDLQDLNVDSSILEINNNKCTNLQYSNNNPILNNEAMVNEITNINTESNISQDISLAKVLEPNLHIPILKTYSYKPQEEISLAEIASLYQIHILITRYSLTLQRVHFVKKKKKMSKFIVL